MKVINWLKAFQAKHSLSAHSIAAAGAVLVGAYYQVPAFHDLVFRGFGHLPQSAKEVITTGIALYAWYHVTHKPQGEN